MYFVWFMKGGDHLGRQRVRFDADGVARVSQDGNPAGFFDRVIVARERAHTLRQDGPILLSWDRPGSR
jgi:hypothetical protein